MSLLTINQAAIEEQLRELKPVAYTVSASNLKLPEREEEPQPIPLAISGTTNDVPEEVKRAREKLAALRRSLEERKIRPFSSEECDRLLDR